ncbi:MAG: hypothetical protein JW959_07135 [Pirellulales bacterium]|nr:hypothetical protein [Pirellulales bacterium]
MLINRQTLLAAAVGLLAVCAHTARAGQNDAAPAIDNLSQACANAEFRPIDDSDVDQSKAELNEALARLDRRLSRAGPNGDDWRKYLRWVELRGELGEDRPPDRELLGKIYARFCAGYDGLELVWFVDARDALGNYIVMLGAVDNPRIREGFENVIDRLSESMKRYLIDPTAEDALVIGESVRWLANAHQCPALVRAIEDRFAHPNLFVEISADVAAAGLAEGVDDTMPIHDFILGTDVHGTAHTVGRTRGELFPDPTFGVVDAMFFGVTESENVGYHGPVTIFSRSTTDLAARKRIWMDAEGIHSFPAASKAETSIAFDDIRTRRGRRMIERTAWRKAYKQQYAAECIASRRAEERLNERIDRQAAEQLEKANREYAEKFKRPFSERKLFFQRLDFNTTRYALGIIGLQAGGGKLAAPKGPPPSTPGADVSLRLHESAINNLAFDALAGRTVYEEKVQATAVDLFGELPEKMKGDEDGKPWAITLAPRRPVSVTFDDGQMAITLRGIKYYKGKDAHPAMNVSVVYRIEKSPQGFKLVRQGEIEVLPPDFVPGGGQRIDARRQVIRTLLKKRFEKVFEPEFLAEGFVLPGKWKAVGKLKPIYLDCRDGWLTIVWKRVGG